MKHRSHIVVALGLTLATLGTAHAQVEQGLQAIAELAQINGQALACQDLATAKRAKSLMLAHAPKTARFGNAFEEGTQKGFLEQTKGAPACPDATQQNALLDALASRLQAALPQTPTAQ